LDVVVGRSRDVLARWLAERGPAWCDQITLATLDPAAGYRLALVEHLANATLVVDHFHAIKLANSAIDDVRRRGQQTTVGHRGRKSDPLYRARRLFVTGFDRLSDERVAWTFEMLNAGDPDGEVAAACVPSARDSSDEPPAHPAQWRAGQCNRARCGIAGRDGPRYRVR
jgi:transposase